MNAKEARRLSEAKAVSTEQALKNIENAAMVGATSYIFFNSYVPIQVQQDLMKLEFNIRIQYDLMGIDSVVVSW